MNGKMLTNGSGDSQRSERDFYSTPPEATQALLNFCRAIDLDLGTIWEPACGNNAMVDVITKNGLSVIGTDIIYGEDYLTMPKPDSVISIITNPPFNISAQFIEKATGEAEIVAFLLKGQYWHSKKRMPLFNACPPAYILPLTWRPDFLAGKRGGSPTMEVIWNLWIRGEHDAKTRLLIKPK